MRRRSEEGSNRNECKIKYKHKEISH
jgi:hypothetical protein